jgi:predicted metalloendopeptidase
MGNIRKQNGNYCATAFTLLTLKDINYCVNIAINKRFISKFIQLMKDNKICATLETKKNIAKLIKASKGQDGCNVIGLKNIEDNLGKDSLDTVKSTIVSRKKFAKQLISHFSPANIKPEDDYYNYINYAWINHFTPDNKQKYIVQLDDFRLTQDRVFHELDTIIKDYMRSNATPLAKELKAFYKSVELHTSKDYCKKVTKETMQKIDELRKDKNNLWKMLAWVNSDEMTASQAPISWALTPDNKNPEIFRCSITPFSFPIVDLNVYFDDGTEAAYKTKYRSEYKKYCALMFKTVLPEEAKILNTDEIYNVQVDIFNTLGCTEVTQDSESYNKVTASECLTKYNFDWSQFTKELGFAKPPPFFVTTSLNFLKCCSKLLIDNWDSDKWRPFWIWIFLRRNIRITKEFREIYYGFHGKFQRGQEQTVEGKPNLYTQVSNLMSVPFNAFLTNEYVRKFKDPRVVKYVEIMCSDLLKVFTRIIKRNTWLSAPTKKYALLKLKHFKFTIGNPDELRDDPLLGYTDNLYDNLIKIYKWRHESYIQLEGKKVIDIPYVDWNQYPLKLSGSQAYIVNASYTPAKNGIYINLGYMQKPFVDLDERGIEYNLAHLGFTIGHEMSHGLDNTGSQYDYKGRLLDWWKPEDKKKFKAIQTDIIKQYEDWAARDGIKFDAEIGAGEDMADISGLAICDEYLRDYQKFNEDIMPIRYLSFRALYTYYSMQMRQKVGKKALAAQLKTNPHPLDKYRTNIPLSRSTYFNAIYNVKKGDDMWWHTKDTIW